MLYHSSCHLIDARYNMLVWDRIGGWRGRSTLNFSTNPMLQLSRFGQSPWCDQLSRQMLDSGQLQALIAEQGIVGLTSNPTIFQRALAEGDWYAEQIREAA